jgi:uncharacterized membrane protein (UPF0127 family)
MRPQTGTYLRTKYSRYSLEVAGTPLSQHVGLGGRVSMAQDQGMLFVFDAPDAACFWMKNMHFSLDMIWLDANKRVVHIEQNVSPETFPALFCPDKPAKYVIELKAGEAKRSHVVLGQKLAF